MSETIIYDSRETERLLDQFLGKLQDVLLKSPGMNSQDWALIGIQRGGDLLAERLRKRVRLAGGGEIALGAMDITLYRDDFTPDKPQPTLRTSTIPFSVDGANILLIDDVFQTGRTIRAALTQLADFGRARRVVLAVFIERQMRELPIRPDLVGVAVERPAKERVQLRLQESDGRDEVVAIHRSD